MLHMPAQSPRRGVVYGITRRRRDNPPPCRAGVWPRCCRCSPRRPRPPRDLCFATSSGTVELPSFARLYLAPRHRKHSAGDGETSKGMQNPSEALCWSRTVPERGPQASPGRKPDPAKARARFGRTCPNCGQTQANSSPTTKLGRSLRTMVEFGPKYSNASHNKSRFDKACGDRDPSCLEARPKMTQNGPPWPDWACPEHPPAPHIGTCTDQRSEPSFCHRLRFLSRPRDFGPGLEPNSVAAGPTLAKRNRRWSLPAEIWPISTQMWPRSCQTWSNQPQFGRIYANLFAVKQTCAETGKTLIKLITHLVEIKPTLAEPGGIRPSVNSAVVNPNLVFPASRFSRGSRISSSQADGAVGLGPRNSAPPRTKLPDEARSLNRGRNLEPQILPQRIWQCLFCAFAISSFPRLSWHKEVANLEQIRRPRKACGALDVLPQ